jgi:site-specific DNA-methyltransferase (adenine-specific)
MNHLFYGDNLGVLRESIADASVDLIYLDPPFNSNASYNVLFKDESGRSSGAQIEAFDDTWHWDDMVSGQAVAEVRDSPYQNAAAMLDAMLGFLGKNPMTAYLAMMAVRLIELHRVLKPTGSLYLHCDPTASHERPRNRTGFTRPMRQHRARARPPHGGRVPRPPGRALSTGAEP